MRILVTGATGFIGRHVVDRLARRGDDVHALVRSTSKSWKVDQLVASGATPIEGDVTDTGSLARAMKDVDRVVHTAALVRLGKVDEEAMHRTNVIGTENVMRAAREADVDQLLHVSSIAALGVLDEGDADETTAHSGRYGSPYERSKHLASLIATEHAENGMSVVQALPAIVFGRRDPNFGVFFKAYVRGRIPVVPGPDTVLSLVHVEDLAWGLELALDKGRSGDRFVFTQRNITLDELFDTLSVATGLPKPRVRVSAATAKRVVKVAATVSKVTPWRGWLRPNSGDVLGRRRSFSNRTAVTRLGWDPGDFDARLTDTAQYYAAKYGPPRARDRLRHALDNDPLERAARAA